MKLEHKGHDLLSAALVHAGVSLIDVCSHVCDAFEDIQVLFRLSGRLKPLERLNAGPGLSVSMATALAFHHKLQPRYLVMGFMRCVPVLPSPDVIFSVCQGVAPVSLYRPVSCSSL